MSPEEKKIEVLTEVETQKTDSTVITHTDIPELEIEPEHLEESIERESLRNKFLRTEMVEVESGLTKPYVLLEENPYYVVFKPEGEMDPFIAFEDYLRRAVGEGIYQNAKFTKPSIAEVGSLLGVYDRMVNELIEPEITERKSLESIDRQLSFFLKERVDHFMKTIEQRIHNTTIIRVGLHNPTAFAETETRLELKIPTELLQEKKEEVSRILAGDLEKGEKKAYQFKAYKLLKVCREIFDQIDEVLQTPIYSDPLTPDNYEV